MANDCVYSADSKEMSMLRRIMETDFFLQDLKLYLDTHPCDDHALCLYRQTAEQLKKQRTYFSEKVFPLTADMAGMSDTWNWFEGTWPPDKI